MIDYYLKRGDRLTPIRATLRDATGAVVNLSGYTVRFIMVEVVSEVVKVDEPATILDAVNGRVEYAWGAEDTDTDGTYYAEWEVTHTASGLVQTAPVGSHLTIYIKADLG